MDIVIRQNAGSYGPLDRAAMGSATAGLTFDGARDTPRVLGYTKEPTYEHFRWYYDREDITARLIDLPVNSTWSDQIEITDPKDEAKPGPFTFAEVNQRVSLTRNLQRADKLGGLGNYAVCLIGVKGAGELSDPVEPGSLRNLDDLLFVKPYSQQNATIREYETDHQSERYGLPILYELQMRGPGLTATGLHKKTVHWTRILHVCDWSLDDEVYGTPRLLRVLNRLHDKLKVVGGSAEMFWQGADMKLILELDKEANISTDVAKQFQDQLIQMMHGLARTWVGKGGKPTTLQSVQPDPTGIFNVIKDCLASASGIPKRILFGAEAGELASSQDRANFADFIAERREEFAEPGVLRPLFDRLQFMGVLPEGPYGVRWPGVSRMQPSEEADNRVKNAQAIKHLADAGYFVEQEELEELDLPGSAAAPFVIDEQDPEVQAAFAGRNGGSSR